MTRTLTYSTTSPCITIHRPNPFQLIEAQTARPSADCAADRIFWAASFRFLHLPGDGYTTLTAPEPGIFFFEHKKVLRTCRTKASSTQHENRCPVGKEGGRGRRELINAPGWAFSQPSSQFQPQLKRGGWQRSTAHRAMASNRGRVHPGACCKAITTRRMSLLNWKTDMAQDDQ
jgi:hypothetical protein